MSSDESELPVAHTQLKQRFDQMREMLKHSEAERRVMLKSNSWRVTAPLRRLRALWSGSQPPDVLEREGAASDLPPRLFEIPDYLRNQDASGLLHASNEVFRPLDMEAALDGLNPPLGASDVDPAAVEAEDRWYGSGIPLCRVGFIGSRELGEELAYDVIVRQLQYGRWRKQFDDSALDFVLIDTTWEPEGGWRYGLVGLGEQAQELSMLLEDALKRGVPTVLWVRTSTENVACYAWLMPQVSTTYSVDQESAAQLTSLGARVRIEVLPPAIQPRLHNPIRSYGMRGAEGGFSDKVLFDGWWDLAGKTGSNDVLKALSEKHLVVVDSEWHVGGVRIPDLPVYRNAMLGCLSGAEKAGLSKLVPIEYLVDSELIPRWRREERALRSAACGALVISEPSIGNGPLSGVPSVVEAGPDPRSLIDAVLADPLERLRTCHLGFRQIMSTHRLCYRIQRIMRDLGLEPPLDDVDPRIAAVLVSMRPDRIADCLTAFRAQDYPSRELIIVMHGDSNLEEIRRSLRNGERVIHLSKERSLADCLNFAMAQTDAPYWAKIDDDDHYGPAYLSDLMLYRHTSKAQVWGKPPMFLHSEAHDELGWDPIWAEHANLLHRSGEATRALVAGGTLAGRREVFDVVRFHPKRRGGSDSEFIRQCYTEGFDVLSTDGFNFVRFRSDIPGFHTWQVSSAELRHRVKKLGGGRDVGRLAFV